ncbi:MAG: hypothetical protein ACUVQQ_09600 [Thermogutta sp.]
MIASVWCAFAVLIVLGLSGYPLARLLLPKGERPTSQSLLRLGLSLPLGSLLFAALFYLPLVLGKRWTAAYCLGVWAFQTGLAVVAVRLFLRGHRRWMAAWSNAPPTVKLAISAVVVILLSAATVAANLGLQGYDARAIYALKAKILAEQGTLSHTDFRDIHRLHFHPGYPLLVPILESPIFRLCGNASDQGLPLLFWGFHVTIALLLSSHFVRHQPTAAGWLTFLFILTPWFWKFSEGAGLSGSADIVFAAYLLAAAVCGARMLNEDGFRYALSCGLALAGALAVKQEGVLWCGLILLSLSSTWIVAWRRNRLAMPPCSKDHAVAGGRSTVLGVGFRWLPLAKLGIVALTVLPMFLLLRLTHGDIPRSPLYRSYLQALSWEWAVHCVGRIPQIAAFTFSECVNNVWGFGWGALLLSLLLKRRYPVSAETVFLRLLTILGVTSYLAVFLVTPYPLTYHLFTAFRRLMFHVYPLILLVLAEQWYATGIIEEWGRVFCLGGNRTRVATSIPNTRQWGEPRQDAPAEAA